MIEPFRGIADEFQTEEYAKLMDRLRRARNDLLYLIGSRATKLDIREANLRLNECEEDYYEHLKKYGLSA